MNSVLQKCHACQVYTLKPACPSCGAATASSHPPRYSPENRYGLYRRKLKYPEAYGVSDGGA